MWEINIISIFEHVKDMIDVLADVWYEMVVNDLGGEVLVVVKVIVVRIFDLETIVVAAGRRVVSVSRDADVLVNVVIDVVFGAFSTGSVMLFDVINNNMTGANVYSCTYSMAWIQTFW